MLPPGVPRSSMAPMAEFMLSPGLKEARHTSPKYEAGWRRAAMEGSDDPGWNVTESAGLSDIFGGPVVGSPSSGSPFGYRNAPGIPGWHHRGDPGSLPRSSRVPSSLLRQHSPRSLGWKPPPPASTPLSTSRPRPRRSYAPSRPSRPSSSICRAVPRRPPSYLPAVPRLSLSIPPSILLSRPPSRPPSRPSVSRQYPAESSP